MRDVSIETARHKLGRWCARIIINGAVFAEAIGPTENDAVGTLLKAIEPLYVDGVAYMPVKEVASGRWDLVRVSEWNRGEGVVR